MNVRQAMACAFLASALLLSAGTAGAQQWYAGVAFGSSNTTLKQGIVAVSGATDSSLSRDERDPGYKVLLGYQYNPYFAVEGGYAHLGEFRATRSVTAPTVGIVNADVRIKGLVIDAVGTLPFGQGFGAVAMLGVFLSETKTFRATSGTVTPAAAPGSHVKDEANLKIGLGLKYDLGKNLALRGAWEHYRNVSDAASSEADVDLYSIGLNFRF